MRTFATLVPALLVGLALSGCFGDDASPEATETTDATGAGSEATGGPTGTGVTANTPPVASFVILDNETELSPANGSFSAKAGVNLTFDGSESSDAEDSELEFAWDFGGAGTSDESTTTFAFAEPGNYTITLTVTDSEGASGESNATLTIVAAAPPAPSYVFFDDADKPMKWTFVRHIQVSVLHSSSEPVITQNHPNSAGWHVSTKHFMSGTKGYSMQDEAKGSYHLGEYTHMTSEKIDLTTLTTGNFSFWAKGWGEDNNYDGLYWLVSTDGTTWTQLGKVTTELKDWTLFFVDLGKAKLVGKQIQLRFLFRSDSSCDGDTPQLPQDGNVCGKGKYIGYHLDDIKVAES